MAYLFPKDQTYVVPHNAGAVLESGFKYAQPPRNLFQLSFHTASAGAAPSKKFRSLLTPKGTKLIALPSPKTHAPRGRV